LFVTAWQSVGFDRCAAVFYLAVSAAAPPLSVALDTLEK